jgi:hypothetical protein
MSTFIVGAAVGAVALYGALTHHLVRTADGWEVVPKTSATLEDSYVDVRRFGLPEWAEHRELAAAIMKAQKEQILSEAAQQTIEQSAKGLLEGLRQE